MNAFAKTTLFLAIALSIRLPSAYSMIKSRPAVEKKPSSIAQEQVALDIIAASCRANEDADEEAALHSAQNIERGTVVAAREETYEKTTAGENLGHVKKLWPIKIPSGFSIIGMAYLQQDLEKISPKKLYQYNTAAWQPSQQAQEILNRWDAKGITIDPDFTTEATAVRKDAEHKTETAKRLEKIAEEAFDMLEEEQHYAAAIFHIDQFLKSAAQATDAWIKTAEMYQQLPGRHWGVRLKDKWAMKLHEYQQRQKEVQQDFLKQIKEIFNEATTSIKKFREIGAALMKEKKYNQGASLSGSYGNIITAQRAIPTPLPEGTLSTAAAIKLELGLESLKTAMLQAELKYQTMIEKGDLESGVPNESITTYSTSTQGKFLANKTEAEKRNQAFQERARILEDYAAKTLKTIHDCFAIFTSGGEFVDDTDTNDLSVAYDKVETAAWVLNALKVKTASGEQDPWLQQEKEEMAIADLEQAIEEAHIIAARIGNEKIYEQDGGTNEILAALQKIKNEYETATRQKALL